MLFVGIIRRIQLKQMRALYQWQVHTIVQAKMAATKAAGNLMKVGTDYESDALVAKKLQERQYKLKVLEEQLDLRKGELETKLQMINEELQSVSQEIDSAIKEGFSYKLS